MEPERVREGEEIRFYEGPHKIARISKVLPPCEDKHGGYWYCVRHRKMFCNQIEKDFHLRHGCRFAWICMRHGPEVP